ncbi:MAG: hypothetical protein OHM77_12540 [Candidatus Nitricoxidivorans perseverans]|uniref:Uncharacterized protein n=1 Tax=Candidatus Nitricoxidivorans perseverans TaxID=2975601 RepID=A0AA49FKK1_9PROT|nr:MAG: hypothetical protein OHM77_12540 [Candidatus Nitricoxidivorans perseverans]
MQLTEFTDSEIKLVNQTLLERYGHAVTVESAEAEIEIVPGSGQVDDCAVLYWSERGAHFVVFKLADNRFRAQFFYNEATQFGTGKDSFDNLGDCVITLLQVQSDHERQMQGVRSGMTGRDLKELDDYDGPLVI